MGVVTPQPAGQRRAARISSSPAFACSHVHCPAGAPCRAHPQKKDRAIKPCLFENEGKTIFLAE
jgi:hypothetical protein